MGYVTISEGFRIGASNGIAACTADDLASGGQALCALPDEVQYFPDTTTNYEVGVRSQWLDRRLTFNGALYYIDWKDPQLATVTVNGALPIVKNGDGAESKGIELSLDAKVTQRMTRGRELLAHHGRALRRVAPSVLRVFEPPGFGPSNPALYIDGQPGDRLPGSPQDQGTVTFGYNLPLSSGRNVDLQLRDLGDRRRDHDDRRARGRPAARRLRSAHGVGDPARRSLDGRLCMRRTC